jgi:hypothetical protein
MHEPRCDINRLLGGFPSPAGSTFCRMIWSENRFPFFGIMR